MGRSAAGQGLIALILCYFKRDGPRRDDRHTFTGIGALSGFPGRHRLPGNRTLTPVMTWESLRHPPAACTTRGSDTYTRLTSDAGAARQAIAAVRD